jgi:hypothetical protein
MTVELKVVTTPSMAVVEVDAAGNVLRLKYEPAWLCFVCELDDTLDGLGDGTSTCACPRCPECSKRPGMCGCADKYEDRVDYDR